jgi:hypothetical protein
MSWKLYQIDIFLLILDFSKSIIDPNLYRYSVGDDSLILMMKNMSMMHYFLGQEV